MSVVAVSPFGLLFLVFGIEINHTLVKNMENVEIKDCEKYGILGN